MKVTKKLEDVWKKLNVKQKKFLLALLISATTLTTAGCSDKDFPIPSGVETETIDGLDKLSEFGYDINDAEYINPKAGDTLSSIAKEYGMTVDELIAINDIENPDYITTDMTIIVVNKKVKRSTYNLEDFTEKIQNQGYTKGIDISAAGQGNMDLKTVLQSNEIDFVMVRMSYFIRQSSHDADHDGIDDAFDSYAKACSETGVPMGIYFWASIVDVKSAKKEVDIITAKLDDVKEKYGLCLSMPVCLDLELERDGGGKVIERLSNGDQDSLDALEYVIRTLEERGYYVMIYTGNHCLSANESYRKLIESLNVDTWIPRYLSDAAVNISDNPDLRGELSYDGSTSIRQYSDKGIVEGYDGYLDLDVCYKDIPKIIMSNGLNGYERDNGIRFY